jgi:hypothetical protein
MKLQDVNTNFILCRVSDTMTFGQMSTYKWMHIKILPDWHNYKLNAFYFLINFSVN